MGYDSSAYRKLNPENCPKVTGAQVRAYAASIGIEVRNEGLYGKGGMWFYTLPGETRRNLGPTNYLALERLKKLAAQPPTPAAEERA